MSNNKMYYGSICHTDYMEMIKTGKFRGQKSEKNGKIYVNVTFWVNEFPDQYGNDGSIKLNLKEEFKDERMNQYIGNVKLHKKAEPEEISTSDFDDDEDDTPLPF